MLEKLSQEKKNVHSMQLASFVVFFFFFFFFFFNTPQWKILDFEIYDVAQY